MTYTSHNTKVNLIRKGLSDIEVMDETKLYEKMHLAPSQIRDYKGLTGDSSDNLKGIPGIGEKTALKLIEEYQTLENIIEALINGEDYYNKVKAGKISNLWKMEFESILYVPMWSWEKKHGKTPDDYSYCTAKSYETGSNVDGWRWY